MVRPTIPEDGARVFSRFEKIWFGLQCWGLWPAAVMVLARMEAAALGGDPLWDTANHIAFAGTLGLYGLDRLLERRRQTQLGERHRAPAAIHGLMATLVVVVGASGLPHLHREDFVWAAWLMLCGGLYCWVTLGLRQVWPPLKELLGALCFACVVLLNHPTPQPWLWPPFLALGCANFIWAAHEDRARDSANRVPNVCNRYPSAALPGARLLALGAAVGFVAVAGPWQWFSLVALAHALRGRQATWNIDVAFLPLAFTLLRLTRGA